MRVAGVRIARHPGAVRWFTSSPPNPPHTTLGTSPHNQHRNLPTTIHLPSKSSPQPYTSTHPETIQFQSTHPFISIHPTGRLQKHPFSRIFLLRPPPSALVVKTFFFATFPLFEQEHKWKLFRAHYGLKVIIVTIESAWQPVLLSDPLLSSLHSKPEVNKMFSRSFSLDYLETLIHSELEILEGFWLSWHSFDVMLLNLLTQMQNCVFTDRSSE